MIRVITIQSGFDEYITHDGEKFWRYILRKTDGVFGNDKLYWKLNLGDHWVDAHTENMEKIYTKMIRQEKLKRILNENR